MTILNRRQMVAGAVALGALGSVPLRAAGSLPLPLGEMTLSRSVERSLVDGSTIVVERTWKVMFARQGTGARITGQQSLAKVIAPPSLANLARIEEARSTDAMFPMLLSDRGTLVTTGEYVLEQDLARIAREAEQMVRTRQLGSDRKAEQLQYLVLMQRSAGRLIEQLPSDLFYPSTPKVRLAKPISLPDGQKGEFELVYETRRAPGRAWLAFAERRIITRLGATEQQSREIWTMAPA